MEPCALARPTASVMQKPSRVLLRTDAPTAVLPAGKLVEFRGNRPDSAPSPLLWLLWYILSTASAAAVLLLLALTTTHATPPFPPRASDRRRQVKREFCGGIRLGDGSFVSTKGNTFPQRTVSGSADRTGLRLPSVPLSKRRRARVGHLRTGVFMAYPRHA